VVGVGEEKRGMVGCWGWRGRVGGGGEGGGGVGGRGEVRRGEEGWRRRIMDE